MASDALADLTEDSSAASSALGAAPGAGTRVDGLADWLSKLGLISRLPEVTRWCNDVGAGFLEEVAEYSGELAEALELEPSEAKRLTEESWAALVAVGHCRPGSAGHKGVPATLLPAPCGAVMASKSSVVAISLELPQVTQQSLRTLSAQSKATTILSTNSSEGAIQPKLIGSPREDNSGLKGMTRSSSKGSSLGPTSFISRGMTISCAIQKSTPVDGKGISEDGPPPLTKTMTVAVEGPVAGLFAALPIGGSMMSVQEVFRKDYLKNGDLEDLQTRRDYAEAPRCVSKEGSRSSLQRRNTVGVRAIPARESFVQRITDDKELHPVSIDAGQTGTVFALEVAGEKIAVFKPLDGEGFSRRSLDSGQGAIREEAAYLVDRLSGSTAGIPVTSRATIEVDGHRRWGSVQAFVSGAIGFIEDFAMPRDLVKAREFVSQEVAEALALLDLRIFNMDRHSGNLLLLRREKPHGLGPIDHGCCLPPWWSLGEAIFDAWIGWAQLRAEPCAASKAVVQVAMDRLPETCDKLLGLGLQPECVVTLRIMTLFVQVGVVELNIPIGQLAAVVLRDEDTGFEELSWLEERVKLCADASGVSCRIEVDPKRHDKHIVVDQGEALKVESFLDALGSIFRTELVEAVELLRR